MSGRSEETTPAPTGNGATAGPVSSTADDAVLPFQTVRSNVSGRLVRLGGTLDEILGRHAYPDAVGETLGQALALTALLGSALKFEGRLILQTRTDGPLDMLVVNYDTPGHLRGYASFTADRLAAEIAIHEAANADAPHNNGRALQSRLLGSGHLAMTIDPGGDMDRYQGIVGLEGGTLSSGALAYFRQSEQLPTFIRLAVARIYEPGRPTADGEPAWTWRAGGLLLQHVAATGGHASAAPESEGEALPLTGEDDEDWRRTEMLAATVEDHELIDPNLPPEQLLYRLFHEEGVRVHESVPLAHVCRCSRDRVTRFLEQFARDGVDDLREEDGSITVTCEFCNESYRFAPDEVG